MCSSDIKLNTIFPDVTKKTQTRISWKDHLSRTPEENIPFPGIFLRKIIFHVVSKNKIIFREKEISSFLIIQERSYSSGFFWKDHVFKAFGKRNYVFSCSVFMYEEILHHSMTSVANRNYVA